MLSILIDEYDDNPPIYSETEELPTCEEYTIADTITNTAIYHQRSWKDSKYWAEYCSNYTIESKYYDASRLYRNEIAPPNNEETFHGYWGNIYARLLQHESDRLWTLQDSLREIGISQSLNRLDFADMIVSFAQDIPYSFIMGESCDDAGDTPCLANQKFGLLSPVEFLYTLKGDCDTRTTLLYKLLKHFGYDVKVVLSSEYAHAMLAVNLPVTGDFLTYQGKRYYFWETTNVGWQPGMLGADMKNINYWKIALN